MTDNKQAKESRQKDIERIVKLETTKQIIAGCLLILAGLSLVVFEVVTIYELIQPIALGRYSVIVNIFMLLAFIVASSRSITRKLINSSQDEYGYHLDVASKAKAYNLLNYGVLAVAILFGGAGRATAGLLTIIVGTSWIVVARGGGHIDV